MSGEAQQEDAAALAFLEKLHDEYRLATGDQEWLEHAAPHVPRRIAAFLAARTVVPERETVPAGLHDRLVTAYEAADRTSSDSLELRAALRGVIDELATVPEREAEASARRLWEAHSAEDGACDCRFPNWCLFEAGFKAGRSTPRQRLMIERREPLAGTSTAVHMEVRHVTDWLQLDEQGRPVSSSPDEGEG